MELGAQDASRLDLLVEYILFCDYLKSFPYLHGSIFLF